MERAAAAVAEATDLPLQIDSSDPKAIEAGIRKYSGVPLVNSVNGEGAVMDAVFPSSKSTAPSSWGSRWIEMACRGRQKSAYKSPSASFPAPKSTASLATG